jgi:hypothetical protein
MGLRIKRAFTSVEFRRPAASNHGAFVSAWRMRALGVGRGVPAGHNGWKNGSIDLVMSIEKESSGLPEVNVHKRTTKVNLSIVIGVVVFFAAMAGVVWWFSSHNP